MTRCIRVLLLSFAFILFTACLTVEVKPAASDYRTWSLQCPVTGTERERTGLVARVLDFESSDSYDTADMILVESDGRFIKSASNRWSTIPALAIPDLIARDMVASGAFDASYRHSCSVTEDVVIGGYLRELGARMTGSEWVLVLDLDISITLRDQGRHTQFRSYRLETSLPEPGYGIMALETSKLLIQLSELVTDDVIAIAGAAPGAR